MKWKDLDVRCAFIFFPIEAEEAWERGDEEFFKTKASETRTAFEAAKINPLHKEIFDRRYGVTREPQPFRQIAREVGKSVSYCRHICSHTHKAIKEQLQ